MLKSDRELSLNELEAVSGGDVFQTAVDQLGSQDKMSNFQIQTAMMDCSPQATLACPDFLKRTHHVSAIVLGKL